MWNNGHNAYLESNVLSSDPLELVNLLYQGCIQAVRDARHHLAQGEIAERSRNINKACEILIELNSSLDRNRGGEIAPRLAQLYGYMLEKLLEANLQQSDGPLKEVLSLLETLEQGWQGARSGAAAASPVAKEPAWSPDADATQPWQDVRGAEPVAATAGHVWAREAALAEPWKDTRTADPAPVAEPAWLPNPGQETYGAWQNVASVEAAPAAEQAWSREASVSNAWQDVRSTEPAPVAAEEVWRNPVVGAYRAWQNVSPAEPVPTSAEHIWSRDAGQEAYAGSNGWSL